MNIHNAYKDKQGPFDRLLIGKALIGPALLPDKKLNITALLSQIIYERNCAQVKIFLQIEKKKLINLTKINIHLGNSLASACNL